VAVPRLRPCRGHGVGRTAKQHPTRKGTALEKVPAVRLVERDDGAEVPELSDDLRVALADVAGAAREGLLAMSVGVGLRVMAEMMRDEVTAKVGPKHAKIPDRTANRHASAPGSVVLGARRVQVSRPRARSTDHEPVLPHPWRGRLFLTVRAGGRVMWVVGTLEISEALPRRRARVAFRFASRELSSRVKLFRAEVAASHVARTAQDRECPACPA